MWCAPRTHAFPHAPTCTSSFRQVPLLPLNIHGIWGGPARQQAQLVVPLASDQSILPDCLFSMLTHVPADGPRPMIAIVESCATIVYIAIDNDLPHAEL
mmetsp:Transcript_55500/g.124042  ORF Transcript_55500/g.124042 Transcript_55500/m.124042 type:complete len:99 (-) Transcript_55500:778-1074(-)